MTLSKFIDISPRNVLGFDTQTRSLCSLRKYDNMYGNLQYLLKLCDGEIFNAINCNIVKINEYMLFLRIEKWYYILTYDVPHISDIKSFKNRKISRAIVQKKFANCQIISDQDMLSGLDKQLQLCLNLPNIFGFGFANHNKSIIVYAVDADILFYYYNSNNLIVGILEFKN